MIKRFAVLLCLIALVCGLVPYLGTPAGYAAPALFGRLNHSYQPEDGKIFIMVIGTDARDGIYSNALADAIHIVGVNTDKMRAGILNFPRDSYVSIPGYRTAKINEAILGGPQRMAQTLENLTGIQLDYWVVTGFDGFTGIIEDIGAVRMYIPQTIYDPSGSGSNLKKGTHNLAPLSALSYVRDRHSFGGGDFARSHHQGDFMRALLGKLHRQVAVDPSMLLRWISTAREHTDLDLPADEIYRLGILSTQIKPKDVGNVTVPGSTGSAGGASVVYIGGGASSIYQRFRANGYL